MDLGRGFDMTCFWWGDVRKIQSLGAGVLEFDVETKIYIFGVWLLVN